jgi:hypothetical protein
MTEADFSAALRNDNQKGKGKGKSNDKGFNAKGAKGATFREGEQATARANVGGSPLWGQSAPPSVEMTRLVLGDYCDELAGQTQAVKFFALDWVMAQA